MQYTEDTEKLADFINTKMSHASQHKKEDLPKLQEIVDEIGKLFTYSVDRRDWYNLCHFATPPDKTI